MNKTVLEKRQFSAGVFPQHILYILAVRDCLRNMVRFIQIALMHHEQLVITNDFFNTFTIHAKEQNDIKITHKNDHPYNDQEEHSSD